ncbi:putative Pilin protein [Pseudomonas syringae pv. aptata]|nr:putative Pilin protein [Pseudomonas syringae pv. aptata]
MLCCDCGFMDWRQCWRCTQFRMCHACSRLGGARRNEMFLTKIYVGAYTRISCFLRDREAASGIEYALVAAMVAVALIAFVPTISTSVGAIFTKIQTALTGTTTGTTPGASTPTAG